MPVWSADEKIVTREKRTNRRETCASDTLHTLTRTDRRSNPGLRGKYWGTGVHKLNKKLGTISKFRAPEGWHETEGPQILGATVPYLVAMAIFYPGLVHFWVTKLGTFRIQYSDAFVHQLYLSPYLEILQFLNGRLTPLVLLLAGRQLQ
jgi:hypothetical protein